MKQLSLFMKIPNGFVARPNVTNADLQNALNDLNKARERVIVCPHEVRMLEQKVLRLRERLQ